jgi:hypothetical protein
LSCDCKESDVIFNIIPSTDAVVATMYAYDFEVSNEPMEAKHFDIIRPDRSDLLHDHLLLATDSHTISSAKGISKLKLFAFVLVVGSLSWQVRMH